ncbi:hypothetical protein E4H04_05235 [Candidatus Bathyarchaeota archaeon]|nr:MAG: hypothetical protein E4H04_05235 [Candidatus Bathyarchaeota archaeon]
MMDKRRKTQAIILIALNLGFFLALDYFSPMPVVFDEPEDPPSFRVEYESHVMRKWEFFLIYPSEILFDTFNPIQELIEGKEYGEFIRYEVEFLEEIYDEETFGETVQAAASMDVRMIIGGYSENSILETRDYLEQENIILISPILSVDRELIESNWVISLQPNSTMKARLYSELLDEEKLGSLMVLSNSSIAGNMVDFSKVTEVIVLKNLSELGESLEQVDQNMKIGIFTEKTSTLGDLRDLDSHNITVYCEKPDMKLNVTTKVFEPVSSAPERFDEFKEIYANLTGKYPTYTEALLYDACRICPMIIEKTRYRPWDNPDAIWDALKTLEGATGNCTLTANGDRMYQKYILINADG